MSNLRVLSAEMQKHLQSPNENLLQHGIAVSLAFKNIIEQLCSNEYTKHYIPDHIKSKRIEILAKIDEYDYCTIHQAMVFHDAGKMIDRNDYGCHSARLYLEHGGDELGAALMLQDKDIHMLKADGASEFRDRQH